MTLTSSGKFDLVTLIRIALSYPGSILGKFLIGAHVAPYLNLRILDISLGALLGSYLLAPCSALVTSGNALHIINWPL